MATKTNADPDFYLKVALVVAAGAAMLMILRNRTQDRSRAHHAANSDHWTPAMRLATGAAGGGLLLYGIKSSGKISKLATTAGAGLLSRSLADQPIDSWKDIIPTGALMPLVSE